MQLRVLGLEGATRFELMRNATANMSAENVIAAVANSSLSAEQASLILTTNGVTEAQILAAASSGLFNEEQTKLLLTYAGLEGEALKVAMETLAASGAFTTGAGSAGLFSGALASLKLVAKGLKVEFAKLWATLMANPVILVMAGIAAAVAAAVIVYDKLTVSLDEARENMQSLKQEYNDNENKLTSLNSELETTQKRIDELEKKDKLTFTEQNELNNLKRQNAELEREIHLLEQEQKIKSREINKNFVTAMDKNVNTATGTMGTSANITKDNWIDTYFSSYQSNLVKLEELDKKYEDELSKPVPDEKIINKYKKEREQIEKQQDTFLDFLMETNEEFKSDSEGISYIPNPTTEDEKAVNEWLDYINDYQDKLAILTGGENAKSDAFNRLVDSEKFSDTTKALKDLGKQGKVTANQLKDKKYQDFINNLIDIGVIADDSYESLALVASAFNETSEQLDKAGNSAENTTDKVEDSANRLKTSAESVKVAVDELSKVKEVINGQSTGNSLSVEDFNSDELKDYTSALEYHNGTLQLNREKVQELAEAKTEEELATIAANKAQSQSDYLKNAGEIEQLRQKIRDKNYAEGETESTVQASINSLLAENEALANDCTAFDLMSASLREATDAYHNWLNAQNASESGDMFDDTVKAINHINDTLNNSESEYFGRIGRTDYKAAVDLIVPESVDSEDQEKVNKYLDSIHNLFTYDDKGNRQGLNIEQFCKDAVDKGLMVLDESGENYEIAGQKTMEDFAKGMNLSLPLVQAMFGEMEEFGGEFDWSDEAVKSIGDLGVAANESAEKLRNLKGNEDLKIKMDVEGIEDVDEKVKVLDGTIKEMQDLKAKPGVDSSQIEHANNVLDYCIAQKQNIEKPIVMNVNTSKLDSKTADAISKIQQFKDAANEVQKLKLKGLDTSEAQKNVNNLANEIKGIDPTIQAALKLDTNSVSALETSINKVTGDQLVSIGIDDSAIVGWTADTKQATVKYNKDTTEIDAYKPKDQTATVTYHKLSSEVDNYNPKNLTRTVTYKKKVESVQGLNGTAHLQGTANAYGNWGAKNGGQTLVGELGREIVVDPHTGKWYTVGDTGAEFVTIPQGAIVFNHKQTESLLANGYVAGRASALVNGTANYGKALVTGGISSKNAKSSKKSSDNSKKNTSSSSSKKSSSKSSSSKSDKKEREELDWIEVKISRIERKIKNLARTVESAFKTFKTRNKALKNEISKVSREIEVQQKAYKYYMKEANKVKLSKSLKEKVKNGSININDYSENTAKKIKEFQELYDKALAAKDAVADLKEELAELYQTQFELIAKSHDNTLSSIEHLDKMAQNSLDKLTAKGLIGSASLLKTQQSYQNKIISENKKKLSDLEKQLNSAVSSGKIKSGSEAWYEMKAEINATTEAIANAELQVLELNKAIRELDWEYFDFFMDRINRITDESDFFIDLLSNNDLVDDKGNFTAEGEAVIGLHVVNRQALLEESKKYAEEIAKLEDEIRRDPTNTDLIERKDELIDKQQDVILSIEQEKNAIVDLVEEGINKQLDALKELIDNYTKSIDKAKDLYEYQKKIADSTKKIASIQRQLSAYAGDTSEENKAKIQKLRVELEDAQDSLSETEYEHSITEIKSLLNNLYDDYETVLNKRLDDVDRLIAEADANTNANLGNIYNTLDESVGEYQYVISDSINSILNNGISVSTGLYGVISRIADLVEAIKNASGDEGEPTIGWADPSNYSSAGEFNAAAAEHYGYGSYRWNGNGTVEYTDQNGRKFTFNHSEDKSRFYDPLSGKASQSAVTLAADADVLAAHGYTMTTTSGSTYLIDNTSNIVDWEYTNEKGKKATFKYDRSTGIITDPKTGETARTLEALVAKPKVKKAYGFKKGVYNIGDSQLAWTQEGNQSEFIVRKSDGAILTPLNKGDTVLSHQMTDNIWNMANDPNKFIFDKIKEFNPEIISNGFIFDGLKSIKSDSIPNVLSKNQSINNQIDLNITLPNVSNYQEFLEAAQHDKNFETLVRKMTIDRIAGKSSLGKYKLNI